ncbi:MAG TPA: hypothetical protein VEF72_15830 [Mycobacterium sp.]|nr:hypothetical protein [Mycobacterium sp.]
MLDAALTAAEVPQQVLITVCMPPGVGSYGAYRDAAFTVLAAAAQGPDGH